MKIQIHSIKSIWYKYLWPKRLTIRSNPVIYRWLWFVWSKKDKRKEEVLTLKDLSGLLRDTSLTYEDFCKRYFKDKV